MDCAGSQRCVPRVLRAAVRDGGWLALRVLVSGAAGMVGRAVVRHCTALGDEVFAHDRTSLDITDAGAVFATLERGRPEAIINCAAWTDVDGCETDRERAI